MCRKHLTFLTFILVSYSIPLMETALAQVSEADCKADPAKEWSDKLNRCMYKQSSVTTREEYRECAKIEDEKSRKKCHDDLAKKETNGVNNSGDSKLGIPLAGVNATLAAINWMGSKNSSNTCLSKKMFQYTALGGVAAEIYFQTMAKKKVKEIKDKYKKETVIEDPFGAQVRAFNYLKDEQKAIKDYSKQRKTGYMLLMTGYGATAAVAAYEMVTKSSCAGGEKKEEAKPAEAEAFETFVIKDGVTTKVAPPELSLKEKFSAAVKKVSQMSFDSPPAILTIAGISSGLSAKLMKGAADQVTDAEKNIKLIDKVLEKFKSALGGFCPSGRNDLSNPRCYCYTDDNEKNPNRSNSQTCQNLYAADDANLFKEAGGYLKTGEAKAGCVTISNQFDQNCKCKKFIGNDGQNACKKTIFNTGGFSPSLASAVQLPNLSKNLDSIYNGSTSAGDLDSGQLGSQLAAINKARKQIQPKANAILKSQGSKPIPSDDRMANTVLKNLASKGAFASLGNTGLAGLSGERPASLQKEIEKATQKAGLKENAIYSGKSNLASSGVKKSEGYRFSLDEGGSSGIVENVKDYMSANYDYAENDIVQDEDTSLFKVISNRYITSGLRRLFDDAAPSARPAKEEH